LPDRDSGEWIALSVTNHDERERFISEVVRMLSQWIAAPKAP